MAEEKIKGTFVVNFKNTTPEMLWRCMDFAAFDKWVTCVESCTIVEGVNGEPGCTRHLVLAAIPGLGDGEEPLKPVVKHKLLVMDHDKRHLSYLVTETSSESRGLVLSKTVVDDGSGGSRLEGMFEADTLGHWTAEAFAEYMQNELATIPHNIVAA